MAQLLSLIVIIFLFVCSQIPTFEHFLALRFKQLDKSPMIGTVINMPTVTKTDVKYLPKGTLLTKQQQ